MAKKILIVDDEIDILGMLEKRLSASGYSVTKAVNGMEALEFVKKQIPDMIILDFFMPGMDGGEVLCRLREDKDTSDIPVIMLTANILQKDKIKALREGVDDYLTKPYDADELLGRIQAVLKRTSLSSSVKQVKNILVTGGAGFIGYHLIKVLLEKNFNIYVIDDFSTGRMENIKGFENNKNFHLVRGSITDEVILSEIMEKCDLVYHLAATVGVKNVVEKSLSTIIYDTFGTELVLRYASSKNIKVILASTSEVYGKSDTLPFREDADIVFGSPDISRWSYACSKLLDEFLAIAYNRERGLPTVIVRFFNVVGPGQVGHYGMVMPRFIKSVLTNKKIHVYGDGTQSRCFTYIDDAIEILLKIVENKEAEGQVINLGNNQEISIIDLANKMKDMTGSESEIIFESYKKYYGDGFEDIYRRIPDLTKLKKITGCVPKIGIEEIIKKLIAYYQDNPQELKKV